MAKKFTKIMSVALICAFVLALAPLFAGCDGLVYRWKASLDIKYYQSSITGTRYIELSSSIWKERHTDDNSPFSGQTKYEDDLFIHKWQIGTEGEDGEIAWVDVLAYTTAEMEWVEKTVKNIHGFKDGILPDWYLLVFDYESKRDKYFKCEYYTKSGEEFIGFIYCKLGDLMDMRPDGNSIMNYQPEKITSQFDDGTNGAQTNLATDNRKRNDAKIIDQLKEAGWAIFSVVIALCIVTGPLGWTVLIIIVVV